MIETITEGFFDLFVMMSLDGQSYTGKVCEPNQGLFDEEFIKKFIDEVKNGSYDRSIELRVLDGCDACIRDIGEFCTLMRPRVIDCFEVGSDRSESERQLFNNICDSLDACAERNKPEPISLYSEIEHSIMVWSDDGTRTAGSLTREIIKLIEKCQEKN